MHLIEDNIELIRTELQELANADALIAAQKFHKEKIKAYGIKVPVVRKLAKSWFLEIKQLGKVQIFLMCDALFQSGFSEEAFIAAEWTYILRRKFEEADFSRFEYWIEHHVHNWAICDNFCNNSMGAFLLKYPTYVSHLKRWAVTDNRWLQRAAAVSLIIPAKQGLFSKEILEIAELEIRSSDDLVQKGYGWLLKVASKKHAETVYQFVASKRQVMPRTALRYAIEQFAPQERLELMAKVKD